MRALLQINFNIILLAAFFFFLGGNVFAQYPANLFCNAEGLVGTPIGGIYNWNDWFTNITFAGINNSSIKNGWITRYTSIHGSVQQGQTYTLSVTVNSVGADFAYQYVAAYIDWNRDGDCGIRSGPTVQDVGEGYVLGYGASHPVTMTFNITVPSDAAVGTTWLRVMLDADDGSSTGGDYGCFVGYGEIKDFPIDVSVALPVELTSFAATTSENIIILNWQTATEVNNYGFEVERASLSASPVQDWKKVGFVQGAGNSNSTNEYSFSDKPLGGSEFKYRLKQIDPDGKYEYSHEVEVSLNVATEFSVKQNFPNPFNPTTKIEFAIPSANNVEIKVFDVLGVEITTLLNEYRQAGMHNIEFNASNLTSGIYFYKIVSGSNSETRKMMLVR